MAEKAYKSSEKLVKIYQGGLLIPPKFMPTYYEWLKSKGKTIIRDGSLPTGSSGLYTVPINKVFFLTSLTITATHNNANDASYKAWIDNTDQEIITLRLRGEPDSGSLTKEFNMPLRLNQNQRIGLSSGGFGIVTLIIVGFEVDYNEIPQI